MDAERTVSRFSLTGIYVNPAMTACNAVSRVSWVSEAHGSGTVAAQLAGIHVCPGMTALKGKICRAPWPAEEPFGAHAGATWSE